MIKINRKLTIGIIEKIAILLFIVFFYSVNAFWGYKLFYQDTVPIIICLSITALLLFTVFRSRKMVPTNVFFSILAIYSLIVISSGFSFKYILYYGVCILICILVPRISQHGSILKIFYYAGIFFAIGTIFNYLFKELHSDLIMPFFSGTATYDRREMASLSGINCPGFTSQVAINAGFLSYGIGYFFSMYSVQKNKNKRNWLCLILLFAAIILANKRAHLIFTVIALMILYYISGSPGKKLKRFLTIIFACGGLIMILYLCAMYIDLPVFNKLQRTILDIFSGDDITSGRTDLYARAIQLFHTHPLFGIGWYRFYEITINSYGYNIAVHNIYLQILCETGIVGFLIFVFFFGFTWTIGYKICKIARTNNEKILARFCFFMQNFFLLYGITGNPLYDIPYYYPYFLICSFTFSMYYQLKNKISNNVV